MTYYYFSSLMFFILSILFLLNGMFFMKWNLIYFLKWNLININSVSMNMFIYLDWLALIFIFTVLIISSMIMLYCCEYMIHELNSVRFFFLIFFFILSMLLMIISPSMLSIILGWDGLGLVSYCLVIYYQNWFSYNSGMLTVLLNRIGDVMIMMSISLMFISGSWDFMNINYLNILMIFFIMIASFTKSAQFPFSSWLPAAMAAPTPVSSLVHSSTLVTAGVYLLIRFNNLIYKINIIMNMIIVMGMLTMLMAGFSALSEFDLKKIIAYSTLSQLGLMMMIYGMKFFMLAFFHLIIHAMFKSMMFMCSGVIIHSMNNFQDIRFMGNLNELMPLTFMMLMVSNFSLCGMPFFSGFYSKDLILEKVFMEFFYLFMYMLLILSTMLTVMYSFRLLYYLLNNFFNFFSYFKILDNKLMNLSMIILMLNSLMFGYLMNWILFLNIDYIYLSIIEKLLIIFICFFSLMLMMMFLKINKMIYFKVFFFGKMWFLYNLNMLINKLIFNKSNKYYYLFDKGFMIFIFEQYLLSLMNYLNLNKLNNNYLIYLIFMFINFLFLLMFF
uniref:NADH dehydrogenase subunit 5 n=1 Tax=Leptomastidea bifasciata TaxID=1880993 RepID=UPI002E76CB79|nr:NADH dehydrogenase subunit 5 [Leptomastidea bifasciata]WPT46960.1 NADH dehydrogenase subunit 5 [Leptomastidea bifasciata]